MGMGFLIYPMFFPLIAISKNLSGNLIGFLMSIPAVVSLICAPILNRYILIFGIEKIILSVAFAFGGGYIMMGVIAPFENNAAFIGVNAGALCLLGYAVAANTIGEQSLLIMYSSKQDREKNLGMFRAASGIGSILSPLLGAGTYAAGGFIAAFLSIGILFNLVQPFVYLSLLKSRDEF